MTNYSPRRKRVLIALLAAGLLLLVLLASWFQPWKLWTNTTVDEPAPLSASDSAVLPADAPVTSPVPPVQPADHTTHPRVMSEGRFISHEHSTTGTAKLLQLADGSTVLRIENLETSEGPKLQVVLSDAPVIAGSAGYHVFDDGRYLDLGSLKGNKGNANYPVPAGADIAGLTSVSIWCDRFDVSFGAAALLPTAPA
jgi:hypothetical protein